MTIFNPLDLQALDQVLHILWAMLIALPLAHYRAPRWLCVILPILMDCPREFVDQWPIRWDSDFYIDLAFFGVGGWLSYLIIMERHRFAWRKAALAFGVALLAVVVTEAYAKEIAVEDCQRRAKIIRGLATKVDSDRRCLVRTRTSYLDTQLHKGFMPIEVFIMSGELDRRRWW